jgi:hypothetical protein
MKRRVKGICAASSRGRKTDGGTRNIASRIIQCLSQQSYYCRQLTVSFHPQELGNCCQLEHNTYSDHSFDLFAVTGWVKACVTVWLIHRVLTYLFYFAIFSRNAYIEHIIRRSHQLVRSYFPWNYCIDIIISCRENV